MSARSINDSTFQAEVLDSPVPVLVDFWAPWCGPCRMMGPVVDGLADEESPQYEVVKVNVDEAPETAARFGIQSIPAFVVFNDGDVVRTLGGVVSAETLREAVSVESPA